MSISRQLNKILIVDDEDDIRTVACLALELTSGYTVCQASSGAEALTAAPSILPDIILLDVMMPGMDGPTTFKLMQSVPELSEIPVVFLTGKVQPSEVCAYIAIGAAGVISKPFEAMKLAGLIHDIWMAQSGRREPEE